MRKRFFVFLVLLLTGCGDKKAVTSDEFISKMEKKGYEVEELTNNYSDVEQFKRVLVAVDSSSSYKLEFYELVDEDSAVEMFKENKEKFEKSKSSSSLESSVDMGNNSKYTLKTDGKYKVASRIDNTFIYIDVNDKYEKNINDILKELNY